MIKILIIFFAYYFKILIILRSRSFEYELASYSQHFIRPPCGNVRSHMISCIHGPLVGVETRLVHQVPKYYGILMIAIEVIFRPILYLKRTYMLLTFRFRFVTTTTVLVIIMKKLMQLNTRYGNKFTI